MSFPWHDWRWVQVGDFVEAALEPGERVLAPDLMWWRLHRIHRIVRANLSVPPDYDWVLLLHTELRSLPRPFVDGVLATMHPVVANEVMVAFTRRTDLAALSWTAPGVAELVAVARTLAIEPTQPMGAEADRAIGAEPVLVDFSTLSAGELRAAYEHFFGDGGYKYPTRRDVAYHNEIRVALRDTIATWTGRPVLEIACAAGPFVDAGPDDAIVRTDFAVRAVEAARNADRASDTVTHFTYAAADAHALSFADASFDAVAFVDAIEHVLDAGAVLAECSRVLRHGGELLLTFSNRNSMNYVFSRKLGYPEFGTNHQHIAEFTIAEITAMLGAAGLDVVETSGIELRPSLGVPGIDGPLRALVDDDPEVVEMLRVLGRRAGAEYAYLGVVLARKR
ncbi:MAG TPA: class I SAM-dependent methyltransferase [Acidimicrobiia bacterium]|nr:class I SAM-dependent methyltransferase [Acidimicrobiia bacterium]